MATEAPGGPFMIIGAGGHGACLAEVLVACGAEIAAFVDRSPTAPTTHLGFPVVSELAQEHIDRRWPIALGVGDNFQRQALREELGRRGATDANFPAMAHPTASVSSFARIGAGTFLFQGANLGPGATVGRYCVLASGATATHHSTMADYSFVAVHGVLGAAVLGERSFVGLGAVVQQGCTIGHDVVVGAQSFVRDNLADNVVAYGTPARARRHRVPGEPYLGRRAAWL